MIEVFDVKWPDYILLAKMRGEYKLFIHDGFDVYFKLKNYVEITPGYFVEWEPKQYKITIPNGMPTDLASIPKAFRSIFDRMDMIGPALVHDYLYWAEVLPAKMDMPMKSLRLLADKLLYEMLLQNGYPKWKAKLVYWAVRAGGASWFYDHPVAFIDRKNKS